MVVTRPRTHAKDYRALHQGDSPRQRSSAGRPLRSLSTYPSNGSSAGHGGSIAKPSTASRPTTPAYGNEKTSLSSTAAHDGPPSPSSAETSGEDDSNDPSFPSPSLPRSHASTTANAKNAAARSASRRLRPIAPQQLSSSSSYPAALPSTGSRPRRARQGQASSSVPPTEAKTAPKPAAAFDSSASLSDNGTSYDEAAARVLMLQSLAPLSLAPKAIAPASEGLSYHQRIRKYFTDLKNGLVYQLSPRSPTAPAWKDVVALRRKQDSLVGFVKRDALLPSQPLKIVELGQAVIEAANGNASSSTRESVSAGRVFGLPFATCFEEAPILGVDDTNLIIRSSVGDTVLQRFSPTSLHQASGMKTDWDQRGRAQLNGLFARKHPMRDREGADELHCGGWSGHDGGSYGWTREHAQIRPESDEALLWAWRYFNAHVITLASLLEKDFEEDMQMRKNGYERYRRIVGEDQSSLAHPWWSLVTFAKGYASLERNHTSDKEPSILISFEEPSLLCVAHSEGFFKVLLRPGQVVFLRTHHLHQVHPLTQPRNDRPHYSVTFSMHRCIAGLEGRGNKQLRLLKSPPPPQPASGERMTRISYAGVGRSRTGKSRAEGSRGASAVVELDKGQGHDEGEPPELAVVAGRRAWEQEACSSSSEDGGQTGDEGGSGEK